MYIRALHCREIVRDNRALARHNFSTEHLHHNSPIVLACVSQNMVYIIHTKLVNDGGINGWTTEGNKKKKVWMRQQVAELGGE